MKFCCYQIWQGNYCASVIVNFEERSVCNFVYRYGWPSVCGLTRNFQEVQFLEIKKKGKKKKLKRTTTVKCVCMKSLVEYIHLMPFKNLLKFRKVKMAKYIYMWENLMQWCEELFTTFLQQVFFSRKKKQLEIKHHQNTFLFNVFAFFC